jgi:hypothetical protein
MDTMHAQAPSPTAPTIADIQRHARAGAVAASPWIEGLGRFGYAAKGTVYLIVGGLALQAVLGQGGTTTDQRGALAQIATAPFGASLLVVMVVGLVGYAIWKFALSILDAEHHGSDPKGLLARAISFGVGILYLGTAYSALRIAMGDGGVKGSTQQTQDWTAWLLNQPLGPWLVGLLGLIVAGNGLMQVRRAIFTDIGDELVGSGISPSSRSAVERIGQIGYAARGVAFLTIGVLLVLAATHRDPSEAQGLDGALTTLASQPFGPYLLALVAAGLAAYGVFALMEARYRRMVIVGPVGGAPRQMSSVDDAADPVRPGVQEERQR